MKQQKNRLLLLEEFLRIQESSAKEFTKKEVATFTGYPIATVSTYFCKYLNNYLVHSSDKKFISKGIKELTSQEFKTHFSQRSPKVPELLINPKVKRLRQRSLDAFYLAVENYNRITLPNRIEVFCILMANAWELLLKSIIIETDGLEAIYYNNADKTLSLKSTVEKCFKENDPIRKNIEDLAELRDQSIHLLVEELHSPLSRVFQASVLNYNEYFKHKTNNTAIPQNKIGLLSLVYDSVDLENNINFVDDLISPEQAKKFLKNLLKTEKELNSEKYAIDITRRLVLTKKESAADITLSVKPGSDSAIFIDRYKPREDIFPFRQTEAIKKINTALHDKSYSINSHSFQALVQKHNIKKDGQYYAAGDFGTSGSYNQKLIDVFINKINSNPQCIDEAKEYVRHLKAKKIQK